MANVRALPVIVFEDSGAGVRAALASGARIVVIGGLDAFDEVAERYADFRGFQVATAPSAPGAVVLTVPAPLADRTGERR